MQRTLNKIATELRIHVEAVPLQDFIPIPRQAAQRRLHVGRYNQLAVYIFDPYSIALSKIERGLESDLEDVVFLLRNNFVALPELEQTIEQAAPKRHFGAHTYYPDFLIRLQNGAMLVLETKGKDDQQNKTKREFLDEWVQAVNADGRFGKWMWAVSKNPADIKGILAKAA